APGEAALLACAIGVLTALLPTRLGRAFCMACTGLIVGSVTAGSHYDQSTLRPLISFEKTVHIFEQVCAAAVPCRDDTLLVFVLEGDGESPLGPNYALSELSRNLVGVRACQANCRDTYGSAVRFLADVVIGRYGRSQ